MRKNEKKWEKMRKNEKTWEKMRKHEKKWEKMRFWEIFRNFEEKKVFNKET